MSYLVLTYWNSSDVGGMLYHNHPYKNRVYVDATPALCDIEVKEEGVEDGDKNFIPTFRKTQKLYKCDIVCSPEFLEQLFFIQQHDHIEIKLKNEESQLVNDWGVTIDEWIFGGHVVKCTFQFTTQYILQTSLKDNIKSSCYIPTVAQVTDIITNNSMTFIDPTNNGVTDGSRYIVIRTIGLDDVYLYTGGAWVAQNEAIEGAICYVSIKGVNYYFDGNAWNAYPRLLTVTRSGGKAVCRGWVLPGTFVQLQRKVGSVWTDTGNPVLAATFKTIGIRYTCPSGMYLFRVKSYSHGCNYGYSNQIKISF